MRTARPVAAFLLAGLFVAALPAAAVAAAQPSTGDISGVVVDPFGDPVAGAEVIAESIAGYREVRATDAAGRFRFALLVAGRYRVAGARPGFEPAERLVELARDASLVLRNPLVLVPALPATLSVRVVDPQGFVLPGVVVQATGPGGEEAEGVTGPDGIFRLADVRTGRWSVEAALAGFAPGAGAAEARFGTDAAVSLALDLDYAVAEHVVVLGSRRPIGGELRMVDSPVTTSVVSAEAIETTPGSYLGDALRAVPGLNVIQLSARDVQLASRHQATVHSNSQLVLMDGRSLYLDFFGLVLWDTLSVGTLDIEQVEVVRGPASATWGANAMTGAVHVMTRRPRDAVGTTLSMSAGWVDRNAGSTAGDGPGFLHRTEASVARAPSDRLAYRVSAGFNRSAALPRPTGVIPAAAHPIVGTPVGGAPYPADGTGTLGAAFSNRGTTQPRFDVRVDQTLESGSELSYSGGFGATDGIMHTGLGPFQIRRGTYVGYGKVGYTAGDLRVQAFTNLLEGDSDSLLVGDTASPGQPLGMRFVTKTFDVDVGHSRSFGARHALDYGGNVRYNRFDISIAPLDKERFELGAYAENRTFLGPFRLVLGGRVDKFGSVSTPALSPRVSLMYKPRDDHSITVSYNRAFRSPTVLENFVELGFAHPVDLRGLEAFRPYLGALLPPDLPAGDVPGALARLGRQLDQTVSAPFPLVSSVYGSDVPIGTSPRAELGREELTSYELSYVGAWRERTNFGAAVYATRWSDAIRAVDLAPDLYPYTAERPPPGWLLPPGMLSLMASQGAYLPRVAQTFFNLGPTRSVGAELWADRRFRPWLQGSLSYSWQRAPVVLDADAERPFPPDQLGVAPAHRFNAGVTLNTPRFLGSALVTAATRSFWTDVLNAPFHGYSSGYAMASGMFGVRWRQGGMTTLVRVTNLLNQSIQQHIFGDVLRRTVVGEVRFSL